MEHSGRSVRVIVRTAIRDDQQFRRGPAPASAVTDFEAGAEIEPFRKDLSRLKFSIAVAILEDDDLVQTLARRAFRWIAVRFDDPNAAAFIPRKSHRLMQIRFCRY